MATLKVIVLVFLSIATVQVHGGNEACPTGGFLGTKFCCGDTDDCKSCNGSCENTDKLTICAGNLGMKLNGQQIDALLLSTVVQAVILPLFFLTATIVWVRGKWWLAKLSPAVNWLIFLGLLATQGVIVWVIGAPNNTGGSWSSAGDALRGAVLAVGGIFLLCSAWKMSYRLWYFLMNLRKLGFYLAVLGPNLLEVKTKTVTAYTSLDSNPGKFLVVGKNGPEVTITGGTRAVRVEEGTSVEDLKLRFFGNTKIHAFKVRTSWSSAKTTFGLFEAITRQNYGEAEGGLLD